MRSRVWRRDIWPIALRGEAAHHLFEARALTDLIFQALLQPRQRLGILGPVLLQRASLAPQHA